MFSTNSDLAISRQIRIYLFIFLTTRQGLPTATTLEGMSFVTTEPAPMTVPSPIVTPGNTTTFAPIQQPLPMVMGLVYVRQRYSPLSESQFGVRRSDNSTG